MGWIELPIKGAPYKNLTDERSLDVRSAQVIDCMIDEAGFTVKRPGLKLWTSPGSTPGGVDGLFWWDETSLLIVVAGGFVYKISNPAGVMEVIHDPTSFIYSNLPPGNPVSFAKARAGGVEYLFMTSGGGLQTVPVYLEGLAIPKSSICYLAPDATFLFPFDANIDPDVPMLSRSLTGHDQYLIVGLDGTNSFQLSEVGNPFAYRLQDIFTTEAQPDDLLTLQGSTEGITMYGKTSTEFWVNDGVSPFSRIRGLTINRGIGARYSSIMYGDERLWIDHNRTVVRSGIATPLREISEPIARELNAMTTIEDARGMLMTINGYNLYVLTFPSADKTFVYDIVKDHWYEWGNWDSQIGRYRRFKGQAYVYVPLWNMHIVGDNATGQLYTFDRDDRVAGASYDDTQPVRSARRTGYITHGTSAIKRCKEIRLRLKRGLQNSGTPDPVMFVRWRNDGGGWGNIHRLSLGKDGDNTLFAYIRKCGSYRSRQYEFFHSDDTDWVLMGGEEDVEVGLH